jgi:hypothetical protein
MLLLAVLVDLADAPELEDGMLLAAAGMRDGHIRYGYVTPEQQTRGAQVQHVWRRGG